MSKVVSLFVAFVCALLFVNVYSQGEVGSILAPDGTYKHDGVLTFTKILKKMEDFTLPAGDAMLEKWIAAVRAINQHLNAGDLKAAASVGHGSIAVLRGILPAIPDPIVHAAIENLANEFEQGLDKSVSVGSAKLREIDTFFTYTSQVMLDAMSKGTPTPETLA